MGRLIEGGSAASDSLPDTIDDYVGQENLVRDANAPQAFATRCSLWSRTRYAWTPRRTCVGQMPSS